MNRFDQESMDRSKDLNHPCMTIFDGTSVSVQTVHGFLDSTVSWLLNILVRYLSSIELRSESGVPGVDETGDPTGEPTRDPACDVGWETNPIANAVVAIENDEPRISFWSAWTIGLNWFWSLIRLRIFWYRPTHRKPALFSYLLRTLLYRASDFLARKKSILCLFWDYQLFQLLATGAC